MPERSACGAHAPLAQSQVQPGFPREGSICRDLGPCAGMPWGLSLRGPADGAGASGRIMGATGADASAAASPALRSISNTATLIAYDTTIVMAIAQVLSMGNFMRSERGDAGQFTPDRKLVN
jgi:hypothetical protein